MTSAVLETALSYLDAGLSVIPVRANGTKAPLLPDWRQFGARRATRAEAAAWWHPDVVCGIGITGGAASGNLGVLDFETWAAYLAWLRSLPPHLEALTRRCPLVQCPRGGAHLYARMTDPVPGMVLARHVPDPHDVDERTGRPKARTLIEVRGDGHQVVAPGSPAQCHPENREYEWLRRGWLDSAVTAEPIELEDWFAWLEHASALNQVERDPAADRPVAPPKPRPTEAGIRPGDDFNSRGTWEETGLLAAGWTWFLELDGDRGFVTRPGKKRSEGKSGTLGLVSAKDGGHPLFYAFTSDCAPFEPQQGYSRFRVYALLKHNGDHVAAARALGLKGYGSPARAPRAATAGLAPAVTNEGGAPVDDQPGEPSDEAPPSSPKEEKYKLVDHAEFRQADFRVEWLVDWFLAAKQPAVVAGPSKGMKTSVLVDLALSLATATPHLGRWNVKRQVRTAIVSGESGGFTLQETSRRILAAKGLPDHAPDGWLKWEFTLPTFADLIDTADFADRLAALACEVVIIDPFYLTLGAVDAKNMFEMGAVLRAVGELLLKRHGITVIIAHHANRLLPVGEPMELTHLAYSGLEQFVRQYVFINRREHYQNDGRHELWYRYGGSAGHSGLYRLAIDEGVLGPDTPIRRWDVEVTTPTETRVRDYEQKREERRAEATTQSELDGRAVMLAVDAELVNMPGATMAKIRERSGMSHARASAAIERLLAADVLAKVKFTRAGGRGSVQEVSGYKRTGDVE